MFLHQPSQFVKEPLLLILFLRVYLKTVNTPKQRVFSGFQIDPNLLIFFVFLNTHYLSSRELEI